MTEPDYLDLPSTREQFCDAVHALAGRQSAHLDREGFDREALDELHAQKVATVEDSHRADLVAVRARVRSAARSGAPWTLEQTNAALDEAGRTRLAALSRLQREHEQRVVAATTSIVFGDSLLEQLADTAGERTGGKGRGEKSRPPVQLDAVQLLARIGKKVGEWASGPNLGDTIDRMRWLADKSWRPQDVPELTGMTVQIQRWVVDARTVLDPPPRVAIAMPCPSCGSSVAYRKDDTGEYVRQPALQISEEGCRCWRCWTLWPPDQWEILGAVLKINACEVCDDNGYLDGTVCGHRKETAQ